MLSSSLDNDFNSAGGMHRQHAAALARQQLCLASAARALERQTPPAPGEHHHHHHHHHPHRRKHGTFVLRQLFPVFLATGLVVFLLVSVSTLNPVMRQSLSYLLAENFDASSSGGGGASSSSSSTKEHRERVLEVRKKNESGIEGNGVATTAATDAAKTTRTVGTSDRNNLPSWLVEFCAWQKSEVAKLNETNWRSRRFLVLRCLAEDGPCGGASDRLHSVPTVLWFAAQSKRLFFIHWTKPAALEEFLVPPSAGGLDWRAPTWLIDRMDLPTTELLFIARKYDPSVLNWKDKSMDVKLLLKKPDYDRRLMEESLSKVNERDPAVLSVMLRAPPLAHEMYDRWTNASSVADAVQRQLDLKTSYSDIWRLLFRPSPPVQNLIDQNLHAMDLKRGQFVAAHARVHYLSKEDEQQMSHYVRKGINCAAQAHRNLPVYFASDSVEAVKEALEYGRTHQVTVMGRSPPPAAPGEETKEPPHLDRGYEFLDDNDYSWRTVPVSDFYETFVDLYLLAAAECVLFGNGNYGSWAGLISEGRADCSALYLHPKRCPQVRPRL